MKKIFFILLIFGTIFAKAQVEKISIGILPVTFTDKNANSATQEIIKELSNAFAKTNRFTLVEKSKMDELAKQMSLLNTEEFIDGKLIDQAKKIGAQYIITPALNSYSNDGLICKFALSLKAVDVSTAEVMASKMINSKDASGSEMPMGAISVVNVEKNPEAALQKALLGVSLEIDAFIKDNFPLSFSLVEITNIVNGIAKTVLISGGTDMGVNRGDKFKVVESTEVLVNGIKIVKKIEIGQLLVMRTEGGKASTCFVIIGGVEVTAKKEAKANLEVISMPK